ncbi:dihydrofolate synthase / folylpolyglutamate synthase [Pseudobutyrivibrio sp. YE44]|uniref:bifunctional folylpolyglutamate synthase/dihydrofolate synthase n=1 Tax=Pseudobutyrivibrio sp. YE44 TaxID=1520802 RepID=UPI00088ACCBB|nr:folylpolyglutamate synthase/dihydrofolate synthase family protein [Pseudobutyrivibrio sp. YE44]SDB12683.1 dihydrofolate synthase / folylpolyglutamate synthase [Pseudobutyrivibrio sp. YE44]
MKNHSYKDYSYTEAIEFFRNLPHFNPPKEPGKKTSDLFSLDAELALLEKLDNPHESLKYIHVAGTNGKGSTSAFIASILKEANIKVGLFTSPFLYAYNEMFRVNGEQISDVEFAGLFSRVKPAYEQLALAGIYPSEYEILTVMAFMYFKELGCELVVLEVSMGGSLDTTNVIPAPWVSVITPISYDHMTILGNTLTEIATEKAGIIKPGTIVVSAPQEEEVKQVLNETCVSLGVDVYYLPESTSKDRDLSGQYFQMPGYEKPFFTKLLGTYQIRNAGLAILAIEQLKQYGINIPEQAIYDGVSTTNWFGRFTLLKDNPPVIIDGGHNRQGALVLAESLKAYFPDKKITFILGILKDKEVDLMLDAILPLAKEVYTLEVPTARTMNPLELSELINKRGVKSQPIEGLNELESITKVSEVVCIAGSLYINGYGIDFQSMV